MEVLRIQKFSSATHNEENAQRSHRKSGEFFDEFSHKILCVIHITAFTVHDQIKILEIGVKT